MERAPPSEDEVHRKVKKKKKKHGTRARGTE
jgi:hypothetical protein